MTPSSDRRMRQDFWFVSLLLLAAVAGCGPLNVRTLGWTLAGLDIARMIFGGSAGPDEGPPKPDFLDALGEGVVRSYQDEAELRQRWLREAYRRAERPVIETVMSLEALDEDRFDRMWKTDLAAHEVRAGDLLLELAEGMELHLETRLVPRGVLDRRVTLDLRGVSRFEAMERVCDAVGIHAEPVSRIAASQQFARGPRSFHHAVLPAWWEAITLRPYEDVVSPLEFIGYVPDTPHDSGTLLAPPRRPIVVLMPGPFPGQRCSVGPFSVHVPRPVEYPGDMGGSISIVATCAAIPEAGRRILRLGLMDQQTAAFRKRGQCRIEIDDDEGGHFDQRFIKSDEGGINTMASTVPTHAWLSRRLVRLGPLVREVKVTGRVVGWLPGAVETIRIDAPGAGPRRFERPAAAASIGERVQPPAESEDPEAVRMFQLPVDLEVPEASMAMAVAIDERGVPFEMVTITQSVELEAERLPETPERVILRSLLVCSREPAVILVKVVHAQVLIECPFELTVPLSCSASQPDRPKPLEIDGDRPLDLVAARNGAGATVFRLTNRSNKGIVCVGYSIIDFWRDKQRGRAMERVIENIEGYAPREGVIVPAGGEVDWPRDFFYHKNLDGDFPTLRVDHVEFTDGTGWDYPHRVPPS